VSARHPAHADRSARARAWFASRRRDRRLPGELPGAAPATGEGAASTAPTSAAPAQAFPQGRKSEESAPPASPTTPAPSEPAEAPVSRETPPTEADQSAEAEAPTHHGDRVTSTLEADDQAHATEAAPATVAVLEKVRLPRPDAPRVLVVANQKGGVGKTTTAVNIAVSLAQGGLKVLVIDLDPQGNASTALAIEHGRELPSIYDALVDGVSLAELARPAAEVENLWVVPSNVDLAGAEIELVSQVARENRLRKALASLPALDPAAEDRFDYVLVDCPPSLGLLTLNALVAAKEVLVPIQSEYYALEGVGQLLETVELVRANLNPDLQISTVLLTMYDGRTRLSSAVADEVRAHFGDRVLSTFIPRSVRVSEAPSFGQSVIAYDPYSPGALSYVEAAREIAARGVSSTTAPEEGTA
jgi:chromosome partitioning protein